jgi:hypothetical protein
MIVTVDSLQRFVGYKVQLLFKAFSEIKFKNYSASPVLANRYRLKE